jgi:hypothetical protein
MTERNQHCFYYFVLSTHLYMDSGQSFNGLFGQLELEVRKELLIFVEVTRSESYTYSFRQGQIDRQSPLFLHVFADRLSSSLTIKHGRRRSLYSIYNMIKEESPSPSPAPAATNTDSDNSHEGSSTDEADTKATESTMSGKKRPLAASEEEKKAERRAANRRSAFQSRQRRKILIEDLQRTVAGLSKGNTDLRKSNEDLRVQMKSILLENHQLRMQQQLPGSKVGAAELMQASALLRGGGQQSALSQLLGVGAGAGQIGAQTATNGDNDSLMNSRFALIAAQAKADELEQIQESSTSAPATNAPAPATTGLHGLAASASLPASGGQQADQISAGLQSLLESAGRQGLPPAFLPGGPQVNSLRGLLENAMFGGGGLAGGQLGGLSALLESASRPPVSHLGAGLTDIQRAILSGASPGNAVGIPSLGSGTKPGLNDGMTVSDALRNLLAKHHSS